MKFRTFQISALVAAAVLLLVDLPVLAAWSFGGVVGATIGDRHGRLVVDDAGSGGDGS